MDHQRIELESVSNLIRACGLIGATYKVDHIMFPNGTGVTLEDLGSNWVLHRVKFIRKDETPKKIMIALLELILKITKGKA